MIKPRKINKRILLYILIFLSFSSFVFAANMLDSVLKPFGNINIGATYLRYAAFIDAIIYIILFTGISKLVFKKLGEGWEKVGTIIGITLGIVMTVVGYQTGFTLAKLGIIPAIILLFLFGALIYYLIDSFFEDKKLAFALAYLLSYAMLQTSFSPILTMLEKSSPILAAIIALGLIASIILLIMAIIKLFKKSGNETPITPTPIVTPPPITTTPGGTTPPVPPTQPWKGRPYFAPRPPGRIIPPVTPPVRNRFDPPTNPAVIVFNPAPEPEPDVPIEPKKPKIDDTKEIFIDLSPDFNPIRSQDHVGACTGFASSSAFEYLLQVEHGMSKKYLSPLYLYYKTREELKTIPVDRGAPTSLAVEIMRTKGVCYEDLWTFEGKPSEKWKMPPKVNADSDAMLKKIAEIIRIDKNDPDQIINALLEKHPLIISVECPAEWQDKDWQKMYNSIKIYHNLNSKSVGGHAMVIVGYHSNYPVKDNTGKTMGIKAFKIRNSWDVTWGENGYLWISAETLLKILRSNPLIIKGHNADIGKKLDLFVTGRVVVETEKNMIRPEKTGYQLFSDDKLDDMKSLSDSYFVGVLAQIKGKLVPLVETRINDSKGRFFFKFSADPLEFEQLTELNKFPNLKNINFKNLPAGVVAYTKHGNNNQDKDWFFHIVSFEYSFGGRGGEGTRDENNSISAKYHKEINHSGIPIIFNENHTREINVIIPISKKIPTLNSKK